MAGSPGVPARRRGAGRTPSRAVTASSGARRARAGSPYTGEAAAEAMIVSGVIPVGSSPRMTRSRRGTERRHSTSPCSTRPIVPPSSRPPRRCAAAEEGSSTQSPSSVARARMRSTRRSGFLLRGKRPPPLARYPGTAVVPHVGERLDEARPVLRRATLSARKRMRLPPRRIMSGTRSARAGAPSRRPRRVDGPLRGAADRLVARLCEADDLRLWASAEIGDRGLVGQGAHRPPRRRRRRVPRRTRHDATEALEPPRGVGGIGVLEVGAVRAVVPLPDAYAGACTASAPGSRS